MKRRSTWTPEEFRHYLATGQEPEDTPMPAPESRDRRVSSGRCHRIIPGGRPDGLRFDSKTEARRYDELRADPAVHHVDVHPTLTLHGGIRYRPDFVVWPVRGAPWAEDVKGSRKLARSTEIVRLQRLVALHPVGVLLAVWWDANSHEWREEQPPAGSARGDTSMAPAKAQMGIAHEPRTGRDERAVT